HFRSAAEVFKTSVQSNPRSENERKFLASADDEVKLLKRELETLRQTVTQMNQTQSVGTHPGADYGLPFDLSFVYDRLTSAGLTKENAVEILQVAQRELPVMTLKNRNLVEAWVANRILRETQINENPFAGRVHLFVGNSSQGKTSALVKFAGQLVVQQRKRVALFTADTMKVGGVDQLKIYAQILNAGFAVIRDARDWAKALNDFAAADIILVDYPALSLRSGDELAQLRNVLPPPEVQRPQIHLVQNVCAKDVDAVEMARRYSSMGCTDLIMTHLDASLNHGIIYNVQKAVGLPLNSFGVGPRIPDDLEPATRERVLDLIFKISKQTNSESNISERSR
ncbi:MAG: flagellar biosynthesis protein FlhF, partial [Bdellovibrionia bacterium]